MKTVLYIFIFSISAISFAQDPQLFENTWYLQNVIIDGTYNFPPSNDEVSFVPLNFFEPNNMETLVCDVLTADVNFIGSDQFNLFNGGSTFDDCQDQTNTDFEVLYLDNFFEAHLNDVFNYSLEINGNGTKLLTITNFSGDQAIYGSELLSVGNFNSSQFSIHPNPTNEELFLSITNITENLKIKIYNIESKLWSTQNLESENQTSINVSNLKSGIYFLNIQDNNGNTTTKKFIKK